MAEGSTSACSKRAELIELLLFDDVDAETPARVIPLEEAVLFTGTRYVAQPRSVVVPALGLGTTGQRDRRSGAADWRQ